VDVVTTVCLKRVVRLSPPSASAQQGEDLLDSVTGVLCSESTDPGGYLCGARMALARVVEPRSSWAEEFRGIAARLEAALGDMALRIDHIGSTSVPELAAKDVIDVQVTVATLQPERLVQQMSHAGFKASRGAEIEYDHTPSGADASQCAEWAKLSFSAPSDSRPVHIHVRAAGKANQRYALLFRDYLRTHPRAAAAYAELKRRLAALDIQTGVYAEIKDPVCDLVMISAEEWAAKTGWDAR